MQYMQELGSRGTAGPRTHFFFDLPLPPFFLPFFPPAAFFFAMLADDRGTGDVGATYIHTGPTFDPTKEISSKSTGACTGRGGSRGRPPPWTKIPAGH